MDYTTLTGATIPELVTSMQKIRDYADSEVGYRGRLDEMIRLWPVAHQTLQDTVKKVRGASDEVATYWKGGDGPEFERLVTSSTNQMVESISKMGDGVTADQDGGAGSVKGTLTETVQVHEASIKTVGEKVTEFNERLQEFVDLSNRGGPVGWVTHPTEQEVQQAVQDLQVIVRDAGVALNNLGAAYERAAAAVQKAGDGHEARGPQSDGTADTNVPGGPNSSPRSAGPGSAPGGPDSQQGGPDAQQGGPESQQGGPESQQGGPESQQGGPEAQQGADSQDPGGGQDGQTGADPGTGGGPSLSGIGGVPPVTTLPPPGTGVTVPPVSGVPFRPPVAGFEPYGISQIPGMANAAYKPIDGTGKGGLGGPGRAGGIGGIGGVGGIDSVNGTKGVGDSKLGQVSNGGLDRQIPQAAKPGPASPPLSGGQAPGAPGFSGGGPAAGQAGGAGGVPPMMPPPMMGGMGGGGRTARTDAPARSGGPGRARPGGPPAGVPAALRGRTARPDATGMLPAQTAADRNRRRQRPDDVNTLQLLDEELWTVENPTPEPQQETRRLAN